MNKHVSISCYFFLQVCFLPAYLKPNDHLLRIRRQIVVSDPRQSCDSYVYCQGELLDTIQTAGLYLDSKTFVDMSQVNSEEITLKNFRQLMNDTNNTPSKQDLKNFISTNFEDSSELVDWTPEDYSSSPEFLERIKNKEIRQFASEIVAIWPSLGRKVADVVFMKSDQHSIIAVPNGFIIPGGRFRELYYWDTYWIIEGLLISDMTKTAKGVIENFLYIVNKYGFIPNGGRIYYLNRSQPPLLTLMAGLLFDKTKNLDWIRNNIDLLDKELTYWLTNKTIEVHLDQQTYTMAHYISNSTTPRPESYKEDIKTCSFFSNQKEKEHCYQGLKSGAESGWDFSSRWFFDEDGGIQTNLTHIDAQRVIPVDLNSFLAASFKQLSSFYTLLGDPQKSAEWEIRNKKLELAIQNVLYNNDDGIWYDFDPVLSKPRKMFYPSNFAPLWTKSYDQRFRKTYGEKAAKYYRKNNIDEFKGGIPTSLEDDNEQWDLPNAWPPLQEMVIMGLWSTGHPLAKKYARQSAENWIIANLVGFNEQNAMFEKYDATRVGQYGGGGEYEVQKGFGWTNGVALNLIEKFYSCTDKDTNHIDK